MNLFCKLFYYSLSCKACLNFNTNHYIVNATTFIYFIIESQWGSCMTEESSGVEKDDVKDKKSIHLYLRIERFKLFLLWEQNLLEGRPCYESRDQCKRHVLHVQFLSQPSGNLLYRRTDNQWRRKAT